MTLLVLFNQPSGGGGVSGTSATTNANDSVSASGTTTVVGTLATTNANDSVVATGSVGGAVSGTVAYTNANDSSAATGTTTITGTLAKTNANDSVSASGVAGAVTGTVAVTNANDTASANGTAGSATVGGGYDDDKKKPAKKRFVVERNGKLMVFNTAQAALDAQPKKKVQPVVIEAASIPEEVARIALPAVKEYAQVAGLIEQYNAAYNSQQYEKLVAMFERMRQAEQDEDDLEALLLAL